MISLLEGKVVEKSGDRVVMSVGGVGYELMVPAPALGRLPAVGRATRLFTRLQIRDDQILLYGFSSSEERRLFDNLVTVTGVGPNVALAILSVLTPEALRRAVSSGDTAALTLVPGVGKKVAGRVILDLKDKIGGAGEVVTGPVAEVREALVALGLSGQEAQEALAAVQPNGERPVEDLLREALRSVGR